MRKRIGRKFSIIKEKIQLRLSQIKNHTDRFKHFAVGTDKDVNEKVLKITTKYNKPMHEEL